jgi:hypothetical protein
MTSTSTATEIAPAQALCASLGLDADQTAAVVEFVADERRQAAEAALDADWNRHRDDRLFEIRRDYADAVEDARAKAERAVDWHDRVDTWHAELTTREAVLDERERVVATAEATLTDRIAELRAELEELLKARSILKTGARLCPCGAVLPSGSRSDRVWCSEKCRSDVRRARDRARPGSAETADKFPRPRTTTTTTGREAHR